MAVGPRSKTVRKQRVYSFSLKFYLKCDSEQKYICLLWQLFMTPELFSLFENKKKKKFVDVCN